jgi:hypothetical protein
MNPIDKRDHYMIVEDGPIGHISLEHCQLQQRKTHQKISFLPQTDGKRGDVSNARNCGYLAITRPTSSETKFN